MGATASLMCLVIARPVCADVSAPINIRNLSPPVANYGLPLWGGLESERRSEFGITAKSPITTFWRVIVKNNFCLMVKPGGSAPITGAD